MGLQYIKFTLGRIWIWLREVRNTQKRAPSLTQRATDADPPQCQLMLNVPPTAKFPYMIFVEALVGPEVPDFERAVRG